MLLPTLAGAKQKAKRLREVNGAHQLMIAWQMYAHDHNDYVLPGYPTAETTVTYDDRNNLVSNPEGQRYPWRLARYLAHNFRVIYVNEARAWLDKAELESHSSYVYSASLYPSLGYNSVFLGGDSSYELTLQNAADYGFTTDWLVTRTTQISRPSQLMAFGSARATTANFGFFKIWPPYSAARKWAVNFNPAADPKQWGYVHPRWRNRAVTAMTDGHVGSVDLTDIQDMRYWCNKADRADWVVPKN